MNKYCPRCETSKPLGEFPLSPSGTYGRYGYCKRCKSGYMRERSQKMKRDGRQAQENLIRSLRRYGVDLEWHAERLAVSGGNCEICGGGPTGNHLRLVIDHHHGTGKARGLLCGSCNKAIGLLGDSPDRLTKAVNYLKERGHHGP